ncbi:ABC transporter ATP-binding protein [Pelomonas sp. APW6]|uniref:ABC transporter ATP-binding protein n=1 Tax=Roseateles subflavus TaxID=3053353 RepID=A0ABT7LG48_9BURK|nr:ABC transporter ATP-binding protein [Pelomonas sp. APW6]MDL5031828.1 ABC transporter ATP-binding protein [Pelomonas sp. APW6]
MQPEDKNKPAPSPWQAVGLLLEAARPEKRRLRWGALWLLVAAGLEALGPALGKRFIDEHLLPRQFELPAMAALLAGLLACGWIASWVRYAQLTRMAGVARRSVLRLRDRVFAHVMGLPMAFFDRSISGQLLSRVTNDTEAVNQLYRQVLYVMLDSGLVILGALAAMAWLDWRLMLIVLALVPASVLIIWLYQRWSAPAVQRARELRSDINAQMAESLAGMAVLQATGAAGRFAQRFEQTNGRHWEARVSELRANAWLLRPALDLLNVLLIITLIYGFGQREALHVAGLGQAMEVGLLYAFLSYISRVVEPLIQITMQFGQLQQSMVAASRVRTLLQESAEPSEQRAEARIARGELHVERLRFAYKDRPDGQPQWVLQDLDLHFPAGSFTGIVGHTGSGKSTLLALLLRFYQAQQGRILVDGQPLAHIPDAAFRDAVGLVPQEPYLMAASARENITMGRDISEEAMVRAARQARIHEHIMALPQGYDTLLGEGGARVSTGQKQLIAMARALAGSPRLLFLDEATASIDSATEALISEALRELHGQVSVIAIAHRLSTIREADQILVLNHGRLAERGTHEALMALDGGIYQRLVQLQALEE